MDDYTRALFFQRDAYSMLYDHCSRMLSKSEWNLAGKTAYDAMEKVAKSVELLAKVKTTTKHDVRLHLAVIERVPLVAWRLNTDPTDSVSICVRKATSPNRHVDLFKMVNGRNTRLGSSPVSSFLELRLSLSGSSVYVFAGNNRVLSLTDTAAGGNLEGHWVQVHIDRVQLETLNKYLDPISKGRNTTAYYAMQYSRNEATRICEEGRSIFEPVQRQIGHRLPLA